ncbi:MAG: hypothetical protein PWQ96_1525 [Clostridia bacterium]|jgi:hypothetical protein|nr:hypothetical protein [Clostridiales bacterium]MDK2985882.1 hypothetical protein [Clostridia bacterium]
MVADYSWLGLPLKTWFIVIIPWIVTGILPFAAAQIIIRKQKKVMR